MLDLAAVLGNGGQPLLVFHEVPRFFRLLDALHVGLEGGTGEHRQRDEKARDIRNSHHGSGLKKERPLELSDRRLSSAGRRRRGEEKGRRGRMLRLV